MKNSSSKQLETQSQPFMDVLVDYAFKRIFASNHNKRYLIAMLNAFLAKYIGEIIDVELLSTEQLGILPDDKRVSYDIYAKEGAGRRFLIEMQRSRQTFYSRRAIAYVSRAVSNELQKGDREYHFPNVISLNFLEKHDKKIMGKANLLQRVMLKNEENEIFSEKVMFIFVDLSIFADGKRGMDLSDLCQKWAYYIRNIGHMEEVDVRGETGIFLEFINECRMSNLNEAEMREYKKSVMDYADVRDACVAAKEDGLAEGKEEGRMEGRMEGLAEGKKLIVDRMLAQKLTIDAICNLTGLTEDEIKGFMAENNV